MSKISLNPDYGASRIDEIKKAYNIFD